MPHSTHRPASAPRLLLIAVLPLLPAVTTAEDQGKCFLWKVKSKAATLYLLGSVHVADDALYPLDAAIEKAFDESDRLVVEVNMLKVDHRPMQQLLLSEGLYPPGETLQKNLSKETLKKLESFLGEQGIPMETVSRQRPWLVSMMVSMGEIKKLGYSERLGIDRYFLNKAGRQNKEILQLETAENQLGALADISAELQELLLLSTLEDYSDAATFMESMLEAWKTGDVERIDRLVRKSTREDPRLEPVLAKLFDERNVKMVEKLEKYLKTGGTWIVVVGAGHLVGEKGLVELLQDKGFEVKQVARAGERVPAKAN